MVIPFEKSKLYNSLKNNSNIYIYESNEEYREDSEAVNAHSLMAIAKNDTFGLKKEADFTYKYKGHFSIGHLTERFLTESEESIGKDYEIIPELTDLTPSQLKLADHVIHYFKNNFTTVSIEQVADHLVVELDIWKGYSLEKKRKGYDTPNFWNYIKQSINAEKVITETDYNTAKIVANKIKNIEIYKEAVEDPSVELVYHPRFKIKGLFDFDLKVELDMVIYKETPYEQLINILELKTTQRSASVFQDTDYLEYFLFIQGTFYPYVVSSALCNNNIYLHFVVASKANPEEPAFLYTEGMGPAIWGGFNYKYVRYKGLGPQLHDLNTLYSKGLSLTDIKTSNLPMDVLLGNTKKSINF